MRTLEKEVTGIRTISGTVLGSGGINSGTGFTVTKGAVGIYTVRFTPAFKAFISCVISIAQQANVAALAVGGTVDQITITTFVTSSLAQQDSHFSFIARGLA
jgi:hypothetical protein